MQSRELMSSSRTEEKEQASHRVRGGWKLCTHCLEVRWPSWGLA